ncbi:F-box/kelch-repeat protein-like protein [Tanacetum coccineum]
MIPTYVNLIIDELPNRSHSELARTIPRPHPSIHVIGENITDLAMGEQSTPFVHGSRHLDPNRALNSGLVYDVVVDDYAAFLWKLSGRGDLNYTSFAVVFEKKGGAVKYKRVSVNAPLGAAVWMLLCRLQSLSLVKRRMSHNTRSLLLQVVLHPQVLVRLSGAMSWCSRLASKDFIRMYNLRSLNDHTREKVLVRQRLHKEEDKDTYTVHLRDPELSLDQDYGYLSNKGIELPYRDSPIVGSCNGIICLVKSREFTLWNFSIRSKLDVPHHPSSRASMVSGFGFDPITNDYKILCISDAYNKGTACNGNNSFLYSMKTDSWNAITPPTIPSFEVESNACFFNENLHWVVLTEPRGRIILTFSLTSHVFRTIELPEPISGARQLTIINGSLALISWADDCTWVWLMSQSDNVASWSTLYKY